MGWMEKVASPHIHSQLYTGDKLLCSIGSPVWCSVMTERVGVGEERGSRGRGCSIIMADLHCCMAETNTMLQTFFFNLNKQL